MWVLQKMSIQLVIIIKKYIPTDFLNDITFPLFRNKRFMLEEMTSQNASKFAISLECFGIQKLTLISWKKIKLSMKWKNKKKLCCVFFSCSMTIFEPFTFVISSCKNFGFLKSAQLGYNNKYILVKQTVKHPLHLDTHVQI